VSTQEQLQAWRGHDVFGPGEEKLGKIEQVYFDRETGEPSFAMVKTGFFSSSIVPLLSSDMGESHVGVRYTKQQAKGAPSIGNSIELLPRVEEPLRRYYAAVDVAEHSTAPPARGPQR
jgi:hypothetical protein